MRNQPFYNLHIISHTNANNLYRRLISLCLILAIFFILVLYSLQPETTANQIQEGIASQIIRFHVIANSDSPEDQALKLKVKDALTKTLSPKLEDAKNIDEARNLLVDSLHGLETLSNQIIQENGYTYTASASIEHGYFPLKVYGDLSLPPGEYEAVRIELGSASGKNWWCIMFPPLCFVDSTYSIVPDTSKEQLKYLLTEEEYTSILSEKDVKVKVKFKLLPWLEKVF